MTSGRRSRSVSGVVAVLVVLMLSGCATSSDEPTSTSSLPIGAPPEAGATAVFLGDSYTAGVGASSPDVAWTGIVSAVQGWQQQNLGIVATGYVPNSLRCGLASCPDYVARLAQVEKAAPAVVVVAGGQNDIGVVSAAAEREAVRTFYSRLRAALPKVWIIAVGPSYAGDVAKVAPIAADVRAAAASVDATYVDLLHPDVIEKRWVIADGVHVDDNGHRAIAARVNAAIARTLDGGATS